MFFFIYGILNFFKKNLSNHNASNGIQEHHSIWQNFSKAFFDNRFHEKKSGNAPCLVTRINFEFQTNAVVTASCWVCRLRISKLWLCEIIEQKECKIWKSTRLCGKQFFIRFHFTPIFKLLILFRERFERERKEAMRQKHDRLFELWGMIGIKNLQEDRLSAVHQHVDNIYDTMIEEEEQNLDKITKNIQKYVRERMELRRDLGVGNVGNDDIDEAGLGLVDVEHKIRTEVVALREKKAVRMKVYDEARAAEKVYCESTGSLPCEVVYERMPTDANLKEIEKHTLSLKVSNSVISSVLPLRFNFNFFPSDQKFVYFQRFDEIFSQFQFSHQILHVVF